VRLILPAVILFSVIRPSHGEEHKEQEVILQDVYVKEGDTLWSVANHYLRDPRAWDRILKYNKLSTNDPNIILPGMVLKVPVMMIKESLRPAYLTYIFNEVKCRRKETFEWKEASLNQELYNEDGLRTLSRSKANIKFLTGELVSIDENSLIIVRPEKKQEEITLFSGAARASKTKVITDGAEVNPRIDPLTKKSDYKTKFTPDKTTTVEVYEGIVDVTAQGKTVTLNKGFGSRVKFMNPPSEPMPLPPLPQFRIDSGAAGLQQGVVQNMPDEIPAGGNIDIMLKQLEPGADDRTKSRVIRAEIKQYHLQIAKDDTFKSLVADEFGDVSGQINVDLKKRQLQDGRYYYWVSYLDEIGFESAFSPARAFLVDTKPPLIEITQPQEGAETNKKFIHVEGKTDDAVSIKINDKNLLPDESGRFSTAITAQKGKNLLTIIARDRSGNESRVERTVNVVKQLTKQFNKYSEEEPEHKVPKWLSTPGNFVLTLATFLIIVGVLAFLLRK
jgi:hypothetical protein